MGKIYVVADGSEWPSREEWAKAMKDAKKRERKQWMKEKKEQFLYWCKDNKEAAIGIGTAIITGAVTAAGWVIKTVHDDHKTNRRIKEEHELKDLYCYDRKLGHYWRLRRELSNSEWLSVDARVKNGERMGDILESMRVLK